jgi:hypothetical protein
MRVQGNILFIFLGMVIGLLWDGRSKKVPISSGTPMARQSRQLEVMSPTHKQMQNANHTIYDVDFSLLPDTIRKLFTELIQPDMTAQEAERVADELGSIAMGMVAYEAMRESKLTRLNDKWIDELAEQR